MRAKHLWEWLREHRTNEAAEESEEEGYMLDPEGMERGTKKRREYGGEVRDNTKLEMVVELIYMAFRE